MKGINTLIKLHKRSLDELRRRMVTLESQKSQYQQLSAKLSEELQQEISLAEKQPDMAHFFGGFAKRIQKKQAEIANDIQQLDKKIAALGEEIAAAFAEVKKFEIARENALKRAAEAAQRKENIMMDEIAAQQFQRKRDGQ